MKRFVHETVMRAVVVVAVFVSPARSGTITFSDATFNNADWSASAIYDDTVSGPATFSVSQVATGGNPGSYRRETHRLDQGTLHVGNLANAFVYDPSVDGAISSIAYSYDLLKPLTQTYTGVYWVLLFQNGSYYTSLVPADVPPPGGAWTHSEHAGLEPSDFTGFTVGIPDFSSTGAPIQFGYNFANTSVSGVGNFFTYGSGIDNFAVTVTPVPEPTALALLGIGGLALLRRRSSRDPEAVCRGLVSWAKMLRFAQHDRIE
jgi:hypothetical protein